MKKSIFSTAIILFLFSFITVYANSSWRWISDTRPYDVLHFVIVITLFIECFSVIKFCEVESKRRTIIAIILANIVSFLAPYIVNLFNELYPFPQVFEMFPVYTVGLGYLFLTLIVELPIVYSSSVKDTSEFDKKLFWVIVCSNTVTTLITYFAEHILCKGHW